MRNLILGLCLIAFSLGGLAGVSLERYTGTKTTRLAAIEHGCGGYDFKTGAFAWIDAAPAVADKALAVTPEYSAKQEGQPAPFKPKHKPER